MAERIPVFVAPDPANPGKSLLQETEPGDTLAGAFPDGAVAADSVAAKDSGGAPTGIPLQPNTLLGRQESGGPRALNVSQLLALLQVIAESSGQSSAGRLVKTGTEGKLDLSLLPEGIGNGQAIGLENVSIGTFTNPAGGVGFPLKSFENALAEFRGIITGSPDAIQISQTDNDVVVSVKITDAGTGTSHLWSAAKIGGEIDDLQGQIDNIGAPGPLSGESAPTLGAPLDLDGNAIIQGRGTNDEIEVLRISEVGGRQEIFLLGEQVVRARQTNPLEGHQLRYSEANGWYENFDPKATNGGEGGAEGDGPVEVFAAHSTNDKPLTSGLQEMKLGTTSAGIDYANWSQGNPVGTTFTQAKYTGSEAGTFEVEMTASVQQTASGETGDVAAEMRHLTAGDTPVSSDVPGTARFMACNNKGSVTVTKTVTMQPGESLAMTILPTGSAGAAFKILAHGCSMRIKKIKKDEASS